MEAVFLQVLIAVMTATFVSVVAMLVKLSSSVAVHDARLDNHGEQLRDIWNTVK